VKKIQNALITETHLMNCPDTTFTVLLHHLLCNTQYENSFLWLREMEYVHGLLQYPEWKPTTDIFQFLAPHMLFQLQKGKIFFVFDASTEGFSPIYEFPFFDLLYYNCEKYKVDPKMIIYVSANLLDENNIDKYSKEKGVEPINVFSYPSFEQVLTYDQRYGRQRPIDQYNRTFGLCVDLHDDKYFSSLSRVNRDYRTLGTFMLCQSEIADKGLISHDRVRTLDQYKDLLYSQGYTDKQIKQWAKSLPLVVDRQDFSKNWAIDTPYEHIHARTIFQIVNETLVDDQHSTSLFYSEKSFKPMAQFQPFVIWGQTHANKYLSNLGYKTYDEWFDLSFDDEEDPIKRYKKLIQSLTETCKFLNGLSRQNRVEWRYKNKELLMHNYKKMLSTELSTEKLAKFLEKLNDRVSN